jgi:hypothetical protein
VAIIGGSDSLAMPASLCDRRGRGRDQVCAI